MRFSLFILALMSSTLMQAQHSWYTIDSGVESDLHSVYFFNDQRGYIGGDSILLKTIDAGFNWLTIALSNHIPNLQNGYSGVDMHWFNPNEGLIVLSDFNGVYRTEDGGDTWEIEELANDGFCRPMCIYFEDATNGVVGGGGCFQGALVDEYNSNWVVTDVPENFDSEDYIVGIALSEEQFGIAGTSRGKIYRTFNNGSNWELIEDLGDGYVFSDATIDEFTGKAYLTYHGEGAGMYSSTDNGDTWSQDFDCGAFFYPNLNAITLNDTTDFYHVGEETNMGLGYLGYKLDEGCYYEPFDEVLNDVSATDFSV